MAFEKYLRHVPGENKGDVLLFALSTCELCRRTKNLLGDLGVAYRFVDVDLLDDLAKDEAMRELKRCNPTRSFPTLVINRDQCILDYDEAQIRQAMGSTMP